MIEIPISFGKIAVVDDEFAHLANWRWYWLKPTSYKNGIGYAQTSIKMSNGKWRHVSLHHCVIGFSINGLYVDHKDGNGLNNRISNLSHVTHRENCWNRKEHRGEKPKSSRYVGVYFNKPTGRWRAMIFAEGKLKHLGMFATEDLAAQAYIEYLSLLHLNEKMLCQSVTKTISE